MLIALSAYGSTEGHPDLAAYSADDDRVFWFIHITDPHIGDSDAASDNLEVIATAGQVIYAPWFYLATHLLRVHAVIRTDQREHFHALLHTDIFRGTHFPDENDEEP